MNATSFRGIALQDEVIVAAEPEPREFFAQVHQRGGDEITATIEYLWQLANHLIEFNHQATDEPSLHFNQATGDFGIRILGPFNDHLRQTYANEIESFNEVEAPVAFSEFIQESLFSLFIAFRFNHSEEPLAGI